MKLIYISKYIDNKYSGVDKKIASQVFSLRQLGVEASIIFITEDEDAQTENLYVQFIIRPKFSKSRFNFINILTREHFIIKSMWQVICQMNVNEILYMRFRYPFFSWWYFLQKKRKCKIVFEHQDLESQRYIMKGSYLYPIFDYIFGSSIRWHCDGIVGVTEEITKYEVKRSGNYRKPHITIGNGISVDSTPIKTLFNFNDSYLHLLCVANVSTWHGIDRVIKGLIEYKGHTKIHLHIVGDGEGLPAIIEMVKETSLKAQVSFYGPMHGKDLDELFNRCDLAVGSLGIHRIGLSESSTLKAREYCARGIPFIYGTNDVDFPSNFPYVLNIPANESPVDMADVIRFTKLVYSDQNFSKKMREYARKSLDWSIKALKLKQFLESII